MGLIKEFIVNVDLAVPIGRFKTLEDATLIVRPEGALAVGKGPGGYEEIPVSLEEVAPYVSPYADAYDEFLGRVAEALGERYSPQDKSAVDKWLEAHIKAVETLGAKWARIVDSLGPFAFRRVVPKVYVPYMGSSITATYLIYPFENSLVSADNKGRTMAIGSVAVEWGGATVFKAGLRTLPGAIVLAQAQPGLAQPLPQILQALESLVARVSRIAPPP